MTDTLFNLADLKPAAPELGPKGLRELLFTGLIAQLEAEAADLEPDFDPAEYQRDAEGRLRSGSAFWEAYQQARGIRLALAAARSRLVTDEGYLIADRERTRTTWTETELACARHHDSCPRCTAARQDNWRGQRERDHLEAVRAAYVEGINRVLRAIRDPERTVTVAQADKALQQVQDAADRLWRKPATQSAPSSTGEAAKDDL